MATSSSRSNDDGSGPDTDSCKSATATTTTMRAIAATEPGGCDRLSLLRVPRPNLAMPTDVLIRVSYAELNPVDLHKLRSFKPPPSSPDDGVVGHYFVPGFGGSGVVADVGDGVREEDPSLEPGTRVAFLLSGSGAGCNGSYSEYVVADCRCVAKVPDGVPLRDAAASALAALTAYESLVKLGLGPPSESPPSDRNGKTQKSKKHLLIVGGSGGAGSWATLLARAWWRRRPNSDSGSGGDSELEITVTSSSPAEKSVLDWCRTRLGATRVVHHDAIDDGTIEKSSVDAVLCLAEPKPPLFGALANVVKPYGGICLVVAGESIKSLDLGFCFFKCVNIFTETVFSSIRTNYEVIRPSQEMQTILQMVDEKKIPQVPLSPLLLSDEGGAGTGNSKLEEEAKQQYLSDDWTTALDPGGLLQTLASGHARGKLAMRVAAGSASSEI